MNYGFRWYVNGLSVVEFDGASEPQFIECPRGAQPGRACFWLRRDDADSLFAVPDAEHTIKAEVYYREDGPWEIVETIEFKGYIACERSEWDALTDGGNVYVTLKDKRHKLARSAIDRIFNSVFLVALTSSGTRTLYTIYEPKNCAASNTPYTYAQILTAIFAPSGIAAPALPISRPSPDNILTQGSCSDVLAGLLASLGCDLVYDPYSATMTIVQLSATQTLAAITAAEASGRLLHTADKAIEAKYMTGEVVATPADYFPIRHVDQDVANFGTGKQAVLILDHQLADETTFKVSAARMVEIKQAVQDWHLAESASFDKTYFGVVKETPGAGLRSLAWLVTGHDDASGSVCTRAVNDAIQMPWITRAEHVYQASIAGETLSTGLSASSVGRVTLWAAVDGGAFAATTVEVEAIAFPIPIVGKTRVVMWAGSDRWLTVLSASEVSRILGVIKYTFTESDATCYLNSLEGIDGELTEELVTFDELTAFNRHKWNGAAGGTARAEYNQTKEQWELYQADCSEDQGTPISPVPEG